MPEKAARWQNHFLDGGLVALDKDAPRPARTPTITPARVQEVVRKTTQEKPADATHWSTRTIAQASRLSEKSIFRTSLSPCTHIVPIRTPPLTRHIRHSCRKTRHSMQTALFPMA